VLIGAAQLIDERPNVLRLRTLRVHLLKAPVEAQEDECPGALGRRGGGRGFGQCSFSVKEGRLDEPPPRLGLKRPRSRSH
jgi:hypothetical protein